MGAGKTSIGRQLAQRFGLAVVDLDGEIEAAAGVDIPWIFDKEGESGFRQRETGMLERVSQQEGIVLACGGGVVLAAENRAWLRQRGFVVYLNIDVAEQLRRLRRDRSRPLLAAPDRRTRLEALAEARNPLYRGCADLEVSCVGCSVRRAATIIGDRIMESWQRLPAEANDDA